MSLFCKRSTNSKVTNINGVSMMNIFRKSDQIKYHRLCKDFFLKISLILVSILFLSRAFTCQISEAKTCGPFFLRSVTGDVINPLTEENDDQPFSSRKTCGACHDYEQITKGFHFQQGWERISDTFDQERPWILSDGMSGKH